MLDRASLGKKYSCFKCGTKFYDLQREAAICPECGADQAGAPSSSKKVSLTGGDAAPTPTDESVLLAFDADDEAPSVVEEDEFMPEDDD